MMDDHALFIFILIPVLAFAINAFILHSKKLGAVARSIFYISSYKSECSALLLGGLSLAISVAVALVLGDGTLFKDTNIFHWLIPGAVLMGLGYYDDRYELRARYKLITQFTALSLLVGLRSVYFGHGLMETFFEFSVLIPIGIICINGANLLDGLDTLSIKYSFVSNFLFCALSIYFGIPDLTYFSIISFLPLGAFYFYNKAPAKLYLGEVGGTIIGLNLLFMSTMLYDGYQNSALYTSKVDALALAFFGMYLPALELGVSFIRRVANGKAPFFGDKLHIHYLLVDNFSLKPQRAASYAAFSHLIFIGLALSMLTGGFSPLAMFFTVSGVCLFSHYSFGFRFWHGSEMDEKATESNVISIMGRSQINYLSKTNLIEDAMEAEALLCVYEEEAIYQKVA